MHINQLTTILMELKNTFNYLHGKGLKGFNCSPKTLETINRWARPLNSSIESLEDIQNDIGACQRCQLSEKRHLIVFGAGNPEARLVFIGEAPGDEEDRSGEPFIGAAGRLLTQIIQAMTLTRNDVYICNIVKCRPPGNRNPTGPEIETCAPFMKRQLAAINPEFICTLGAFATQTLLKSEQPISLLRGRFHDYHGIRVMPTYHPAYILRFPGKKGEVWKDIQHLMHAMQLSPKVQSH